MDLRVKINGNKISIINGCNSHIGSFQVLVKGKISFGIFTSTKKFCSNDKDLIYLNALKSSVFYAISSGVITLKNKKGVVSLALKAYTQVLKRLSFEN